MRHGTNFFGTSPVRHNLNHGTEFSFINVGGEQFHAMAVALMDYFKRASRVNEDSLKKILGCFYNYFPKYTSNQTFLTAAERMGILLNNPRKSEMVECIAFVLRQLVVDEIYANPLNYREVFNGLDLNTPADYLRQSTVQLPKNVLCAALARSLVVHIVVSCLEHEKELRMCEIYSPESSAIIPTAKIPVQIQGGHYFPGVTSPTDFFFVGQLAVKPITPVENPILQKSSLAECLKLVSEDNQRAKREYSHWQQKFLTMVQIGEISTADLTELYIKFLPTDIGTISNAFFAQLNQEDLKPVSLSYSSKTEHTNKLLAGALAQLISLGTIKADVLFDYLEQRRPRVTGSAVI